MAGTIMSDFLRGERQIDPDRRGRFNGQKTKLEEKIYGIIFKRCLNCGHRQKGTVGVQASCRNCGSVNMWGEYPE